MSRRTRSLPAAEGDRAALYRRRSKDDAEGSLPVQAVACEAYAAARGWIVVADEVDLESAFVNGGVSRAGYQRVIELARARAIDHVIVWQFSRFGRDAAESLSRAKELRRLGVTLHSTSEDLDNPLLTGILAVLAEDESRRISQRVAPRKRQLHAAGVHQSSAAPLGTIKTADRKLAPGPDFAAVRYLFEQVAAGRALVALVDEVAALTPRPINRDVLRYAIRNPAYIGVLRGMLPTGYGHVLDAWPPMLDRALWDAAQAAADRRSHPHPNVNLAQYFPLSALFTCARCAKRMSISRNLISLRERTLGYYLVCPRKCGMRDRADFAEAWLVEQVRRVRFPATMAGAIRRALTEVTEAIEAGGSVRRRTLAAERATLAARRDRAEQGYLDGVLSAARALALKEDADARIAAIDVELATMPAPVRVDADEVIAILTDGAWQHWHTSDPKAYAAIVAQLVERADIHPRATRYTSNLSTPRTVHWTPLIQSVVRLLPDMGNHADA